MPLLPKRVKYRKQQRGNRKGMAMSGNALAFGEYGLQSLGRTWVTNIQLEACRVAISRSMKRKGKLWLRVFPDKPYTKKPLEVRQGKGKGPVEGWVAVVRPGRMLFEMDGVAEPVAREAMRLAASKLPIPTKFVQRHASA
ncbi:MAG TPA: 50S ribosomal protein L16 [Kiritimatiellia bacterium]|nr:50S ribosomal protein L16 [Kiritimatiellia bacterium]